MGKTPIENRCSKWRLAVNGSKTELMFLNCSPKDIDVPTVKNDSSTITQQTKSLGVTIDKINYKEHAQSVITKAMETWNHFKSNSSGGGDHLYKPKPCYSEQ